MIDVEQRGHISVFHMSGLAAARLCADEAAGP